jgi:diguanylate cyclase (GGDEF)-like protein
MGDKRQSEIGQSVSGECEDGAGQPAALPAAQCEPLDLLLEQKKKLEQLNTWFDIALNNMVRGLSMFDSEQRLIVCNSSYRQTYALPEELTLPGTPLAEIVRYHVKRETGRDGAEEIANQAKWLADHIAKLAKGQPFSHIQDLNDGRKFLVTYQPLADGGWVDIQEDITEKRRAEEKIEWLARHDALTGVANRFYFRETFENALNGLQNGSSLALHWLDLDRFKEVNDTLGHPIGDALLKAVAQRLRGSVRKSDFLARLGGDEFAIIQAGGRKTDQCERLARRVLHDVSKPYHIFGNAISVSASIGIVRAPEDGKTADELLKNADVALYSVKSAGRRGFELFHGNGAGRKADGQRRLEHDMPGALSQNQFELHYQPVLSLRTRHVVGCEALIRWRHPRNGLIMPNDFLPLAERTGAILDIGRWVFGQACSDAARWADGIRVSVNLSLLQLESADLADEVQKALAATGLNPSRLQLEVSESLFDRRQTDTLEKMKKLRKLGVSIALDDFGRASASLANLRAYPFDEVKIDRALIEEAPTHEDSAAIVQSVALLAQALSMRSTAEGVETLDELDLAVRTGCKKVQGFCFGRPVPVAELAALLAECSQKLPHAA